MTTELKRFIAGAAHFIGKRGIAHGVQQRSKQGGWVQVYIASELEGRRHLDKKLLNCSVDLDLRHILHK